MAHEIMSSLRPFIFSNCVKIEENKFVFDR